MSNEAKIQKVKEAYDALPEFSQKVFYSLLKNLQHAEGEFSDIEAVDIAGDLECSVKAVNAALGKLMEVDLVNSEDFDNRTSGGGLYCLLHVSVVNESLENWELYEALFGNEETLKPVALV